MLSNQTMPHRLYTLFQGPLETVYTIVATATMTGMWFLAQADVPSFVKGSGELVGIGVMAWYVWYMTSVVQPRQQKQNQEHVEKIACSYAASTKEVCETIKSESTKDREIQTASFRLLQEGQTELHRRIDKHLTK